MHHGSFDAFKLLVITFNLPSRSLRKTKTFWVCTGPATARTRKAARAWWPSRSCSALVLVLRAQPEHTKPQIPVFPAVSQGSELHAASRTTRRVVLISHFVHRFSTSAFLGQELLLRGIVWLRQLSAVRRDVNPLSHSPSEKLPHFFFVYVSKKVCILPWFFRIVMLKLYPLILADAINPSITWKQAEPQIQTVLYQVSHVCCSKHVLWYNTVYFCS